MGGVSEGTALIEWRESMTTGDSYNGVQLEVYQQKIIWRCKYERGACTGLSYCERKLIVWKVNINHEKYSNGVEQDYHFKKNK